jgi:hypothetical protein
LDFYSGFQAVPKLKSLTPGNRLKLDERLRVACEQKAEGKKQQAVCLSAKLNLLNSQSKFNKLLSANCLLFSVSANVLRQNLLHFAFLLTSHFQKYHINFRLGFLHCQFNFFDAFNDLVSR